MSEETYEQLAYRTKSDGFWGELVDIEELYNIITDGIALANRMDKYKKALFYGRQVVDTPLPDREATILSDNPHRATAIDLLHAALGAFTEAGELLEVFNNFAATGQLDVVNLNEEIGDMMWYLALGAKLGGKSFAEIQSDNIAKLSARYPDRFTQEAANNRNLEAERAVLEGQ